MTLQSWSALQDFPRRHALLMHVGSHEHGCLGCSEAFFTPQPLLQLVMSWMASLESLEESH